MEAVFPMLSHEDDVICDFFFLMGNPWVTLPTLG